MHRIRMHAGDQSERRQTSPEVDAADEAKNLHPLDASGASSAATAALLHQQLRPYVKVSLHGGEFAGAASLLRACVHGGEFAFGLGLGSP